MRGCSGRPVSYQAPRKPDAWISLISGLPGWAFNPQGDDITHPQEQQKDLAKPPKNLMDWLVRINRCYLASQYKRFNILRFPDDEVEHFKQVSLIAIWREKYNIPTNEETESIQRLAKSDLSPLGFAPEPVYPLLPASPKGAGGKSALWTE